MERARGDPGIGALNGPALPAGSQDTSAHLALPRRRRHGDFDTLLVWTEAGVLVDESVEAVAAIENRDPFHGGSKRVVSESAVTGPQEKLLFGLATIP